ncbi:hypothetical protein LE181_25535 [Streptomyces sp. SCA3-4]|uniref:hypothetical protein n=1 Tax=Streptomyces sichuanensis TaxID=2871810 RepID=UPI001CE25295|nr:hypothetical protein [Streptomyces sichuanensis]MCA6095516.1 hypothetical protein [Streptomyces sichuanensis]
MARGVYDPSGHGAVLFAFFVGIAEFIRELIVQGTHEGLDATAPAAPASAGHQR